MSAGTIAIVVVALSVAAWGLFMLNVARKNRRGALATAGQSAPAAQPEHARASSGGGAEAEVTVGKAPKPRPKPLSPEQMAVTRRQFLNRAWTASFSAFLGFFGMATLSFLWPKLTGGFGTEIAAGDYDDIMSQIGPEAGYRPLFVPEGRFWLVAYVVTGDCPVYEATCAK